MFGRVAKKQHRSLGRRLGIVASLMLVMVPTTAMADPPPSAAPDDKVAVEPDITKRADVIVDGTVGERRDVPGTDGFSVDSIFKVRLDRAIKGAKGTKAGKTIDVRIHGGLVSKDRFLFVSEEPRLTAGQKATFYLKSQLDGTHRPLGEESVVLVGAPGSHCGGPQPVDGHSGYEPYWQTWAATSFEFKLNSTNPRAASTDTAAFNAAAATWNGGGGAISILNGGTTSASGVSSNGENVISFEYLPSDDALARAFTFVRAVNGVPTSETVETDIRFNTRFTFSSNPGPGEHDVQSVALHEMGHSLGLAHVEDSAQVMTPCIDTQQIKLTLPGATLPGIEICTPPTPRAITFSKRMASSPDSAAEEIPSWRTIFTTCRVTETSSDTRQTERSASQ